MRRDEEILFKLTFQGKWSEVVEMYRSKPSIRKEQMMNTEDTVLHMAVDDDQEDIVEELLKILEDTGNEAVLKIKNERGDTPLHRAAIRGSVAMCMYIAEHNLELLTVTNNWGETPLFLANHKDVFLYLHSAHIREHIPENCRRKDGDSLLHYAIERERFDLAFYIIHAYPDLVSCFNERGMTPLHLLASKPLAFKSGSRLTWWNKILYYCIHVDPLMITGIRRRQLPRSFFRKKEYPKNYQTCYDIAIGICSTGKEYYGAEENSNYHARDQNIPENYATCYELLTTVIVNLFGFLGLGHSYTVIKNFREKHTWSVQILDKLMENPSQANINGGRYPNLKESAAFMGQKIRSWTMADGKMDANVFDTPFLTAGKNGVVEIMEKILRHIPEAIYETNTEKKNILHLSVENRQPYIFEALRNNSTVRDNLIGAVDKDDNNVLHLAALQSKFKPWRIAGSALQMQWEVKWFLYVRDLMPEDFHFKRNETKFTAAEDVFEEHHQGLLKESSKWLKSTSQSCSVVAALIAGVAFATSSSIPGGTQDETGKPYLENHPAFNIFAITSLLALCFSVTALVMFLSILTSRQQWRDFHHDLPYKLLLGLTSLFLSIPSMLVSFCAGHFFVLKDNLKQAVFPIYATTCFPVVIFFAASQFPLYVDLLKATYKKVPQSGHQKDTL